MQAFVLAAGLGTRLHPLTDTLPKALVEVHGVPLIKIAIDNLVHQGATRIIVNIHHFADLLRRYLQNHSWGADILISDESDLLLDTGGGLKKASPLFLPDDPILIHNVDILSHIHLAEVIKQHTDSMNLATLVTSQRNTSRQLLFDSKCQLAGWQNSATGDTRWVNGHKTGCKQLAYSGIAVIQPEMLALLPEATQPYSIIPAYLSLAKNHRISYFMHNPKDWLDVGKPDTLQRAQNWKFDS